MKVSKWVYLLAVAALAWTVPAKAETIRYTIAEGETAPAAEASGCCDDTACCDAGCDDSWTLSLFAPSDHCFDDFISPMTNPVYFEDPRTLSEARLIFLTHKVPAAALGGRVNIVALQLRAALNDRLSIIATKDGFATSDNTLIQDGWLDINVGLKYNLYRDAACGQLLSAGVTYEAPFGSPQTQQGNGDGVFNLFTTGGTRIGQQGHWISTGGFTLAANPAVESDFAYWSNHFDRRLGDSIAYGFTEFNWYHWTRSGASTVVPGVEGLDLFNLGSTGVAGNDIVTGAFGVKLKPSNHTELGVAWELPLTDRRDILDNRLTADFIIRY